jgi:predicted Zn-dependent protease
MTEYDSALAKIQKLECPTGDLEERIMEILTDYHVAEEDEIQIVREQEYDRGGAQAYKINFDQYDGHAIIVLARSGADDYVARVTDVAIMDFKNGLH